MSSEQTHHTTTESDIDHNYHHHPKGSKWWTAMVGIVLLSLVITGLYLGVKVLLGR